MKSSSGEHYIALDHLRGVAAFLVFSWHFLHGWSLQFPVPQEYTPAVFPFSIINQGHTGVALFMTLSGYLFAKLLDGRRVNYPAFFWNRMLRLFPLLFLVLFVQGVRMHLAGGDVFMYIRGVAMGFITEWLGNGAWSIVVELHFYLLLPLILFLGRKSKLALPLFLLAAIALRVLLHHQQGDIRALAYFTIVGRIDQFLFGILAFSYRKAIAGRHALFLSTLAAFLLFYWWFNLLGGFGSKMVHTTPSEFWIFIPTLEGLAYGVLISYYDGTYRPENTGLSKFIGYFGTYSYSIYLLHFFLIFQTPTFISKHFMALSNFYVACVWALLCFILMLPIGYLSFRFIESPFLKFRRRYTYAAPEDLQPAPVGS